ncbi:LacI family DNA-binding transcriptional regulator [Frigoribacterium faeni]|uniref:LacI family transcriptional regulator n=1 Tax=Frigoribacterium faeni TaxID=145483 RepID=A0A7W3PJE6_9MICO|nr:LacI family DNA-binding transcriptional regulator [Frigoribacterium faeni]MBA8813747.1 LacI family transcriptional regulator [Frigoribacterium faeni]BFF15049.1 LacI family DNA-binding transcriptional regulator [Microbacterium flavescens]GEK83394.1 LacI family transcriptional regulator [Frigoribacterium faeni]
MRQASIRDVAETAGVSVGTVSNVLNNPAKVSESTIARVSDAIATLGFVRNDAARQLRGGDSRVIGLIILDGGNPFFTDVARGAEAAAETSGRVILLGNSDQLVEREAHYLDLFDERRVMGILISPVGDVSDRLRRLRRRGMPAVLVDRRADLTEFSSVSVDDVRGGYLATEHLLGLGRRRIAFVGGPSDLQQVADRLEGARAAVAAVPGATLEVVEVAALTVQNGREAAAALARRPLDRRPDAVFAANDLAAMGVLQALVMQGDVRVPDDIDFARAAVVPLSSVRQPSALIGQTAVEILGDEADDPERAPRQIVFEPELVVRESTTPGVSAG